MEVVSSASPVPYRVPKLSRMQWQGHVVRVEKPRIPQDTVASKL